MRQSEKVAEMVAEKVAEGRRASATIAWSDIQAEEENARRRRLNDPSFNEKKVRPPVQSLYRRSRHVTSICGDENHHIFADRDCPTCAVRLLIDASLARAAVRTTLGDWCRYRTWENRLWSLFWAHQPEGPIPDIGAPSRVPGVREPTIVEGRHRIKKDGAVLNCRVCFGLGYVVTPKGRFKCENCYGGRQPIGMVFAVWCFGGSGDPIRWGHRARTTPSWFHGNYPAWRSSELKERLCVCEYPFNAPGPTNL